MNIGVAIGRYVSIWRAAVQIEAERPAGPVTAGRALEFLPAVLEIQHSPPSPIGRAMVWTIMGVVAAALAWSCVGRVDIVAVAPGKIIPSGHSKVIQPFDTGVVAGIRVQDGQVVTKGQVLIELDPTQNRADHDRAENEYRAAKVEAARLRALIAGQASFDAPSDADPQYLLLQQQLLRDQLTEFQARIDASQQLIGQRRAALDGTKENIRRLKATVPMGAERADAYRKLLQSEYVSKLEYLQYEEQRIDKLQEFEGQKQKVMQDTAALSEAEKNYRALISEFQQTKQAELATTETKAASLAQDIIKAAQKAELQRLVSPIDGVVQQLAVHTVGGVVTSAQQLLIVVPQDHPVEVEAQVENKDVGFVKEGQSVEVKVETFPFTLYGTIPGQVISVSDDAVPIDKERSGTLIYFARVGMDRATIEVQGKQVNLSPGMAVMVEIKTGQRRIIEYLLSPLLKSMKESLRER